MTAVPLEKQAVSLDFDAVYEAYFSYIWKSLRRLGVPPESIDDAAQDVFLVVHRKLEGFEGRSSLKTWLFGITHLVALGYCKKKNLIPSEQVPDALPSSASGPLEHASSNEALRFVEGFLDSLDDLKRPIFVLAEFEQMTAPEIAEALGVKLNTVYSRLRLAREAFQGALKRRAGVR